MKQKFIKMYFYLDVGNGIKLVPVYFNEQRFKLYKEYELIKIAEQQLKALGHEHIVFASRINGSELYIVN